MIARAGEKEQEAGRGGVIFTSVDASSTEVTISAELRRGLGAEEADRRIAAGNRAGDMGARIVSFYLLDLADRGGHQEFGFHSILDYAETRFGIQRRTAREYMAVERALDELPLIDEALREGRLFWSQTRLLVRIATPETERAWLGFAADRTIRQIASQVRNREKGQLPTDPVRRRIHSITYKVEGSLSAVQFELWNNARAKLEAESDRPVSDAEMMLEAAMLLLATRPDGSVPGRTPVNDSHFKVVVDCPAQGGAVTLRAEGGPVLLDPETSAAILRDAGHPELVAVADRDIPTPNRLRRRILARDGYRCTCCGAKKNLTVHHIIWLRYGGRTVAGNLITLCEDCHSLVHDGKLMILATITDELRFADEAGRELSDPGRSPGAVVKRPQDGARAPAARRVRLQDIPEVIDTEWWFSHAHLLHWRAGEGTFEFRPGEAVAIPNISGARAPHDALTPRHGRLAASGGSAGQDGLDGMVGQDRAVANLRRMITAARHRGEPVRHILLYGPAGLGKTKLAGAVAVEMAARLHTVSAPVLKDPGVLLGLLSSLGDGDVLLLDEIHRLPTRIVEVLYEAMQDGHLSLTLTSGIHRRTVRLKLNRFTLVGATTADDLLPAPLRSRFELRLRLEFYPCSILAGIVTRAAATMDLDIDDAAAGLLARSSRDTPREALALLRSARDLAAVRGQSAVGADTVRDVLDELGVDGRGLWPADREYLDVLDDAESEVSLTTIAARLGAQRRTVRRSLEPYLIRRGLVEITPRGRVLTRRR